MQKWPVRGRHPVAVKSTVAPAGTSRTSSPKNTSGRAADVVVLDVEVHPHLRASIAPLFFTRRRPCWCFRPTER